MNYQNSSMVKDFAVRTQRNLAAIERLKANMPNSEVYEVTQLINSMLGLLVFPQQIFYRSLPETPLSELVAVGWPVSLASASYPPDGRNLRTLMRCMRNAIAHCNIDFLADEDNQIAGVRLWNTRQRGRKWEVTLDLKGLREIIERFVEIILQLDDSCSQLALF